MTKPVTYSDSGVDIDAANRATAKIKDLARRTFNERTLRRLAASVACSTAPSPQLKQPVLVASADGVGTKLKIAFLTGVHDTIGRDLVNHCVNDILVQVHVLSSFLITSLPESSPEVVAGVVAGITEGCRENGCVLLGGETAEMQVSTLTVNTMWPALSSASLIAKRSSMGNRLKREMWCWHCFCRFVHERLFTRSQALPRGRRLHC